MTLAKRKAMVVLASCLAGSAVATDALATRLRAENVPTTGVRSWDTDHHWSTHLVIVIPEPPPPRTYESGHPQNDYYVRDMTGALRYFTFDVAITGSPGTGLTFTMPAQTRLIETLTMK